MLHRLKREDSGFTVIELLVVTLIVGALAAIAVSEVTSIGLGGAVLTVLLLAEEGRQRTSSRASRTRRTTRSA